ncbi:MAG: 3-methylornithine--L-lysine ligase PylC [Candidatus Methanomethylophilaceae archaeon]|nr:3-methylornithine--L-lysine ligase PylC [Candidatus Methanomethylophilaceae archaeon]
MEAVLLAKKAGYDTLVVDRRSEAPALSICDEAVVGNPLSDDGCIDALKECDAVIPACEEIDLLQKLDGSLSGTGVPFLFDLRSYRVSSSKLESNEIMARAGVALPKPWPECGFPVIVKPSSQSGSVGVSVAYSQEDIESGLVKVRELGDEAVIQEFVHGRSLSVEVIGNGREAESYVTTEVVLDQGYDCKMVRCSPDILSTDEDKAFGEMAQKTARMLGLNGLMDLEAIDTPKGLRVLEIDARIPSQTPAAIQAATGVNLLEELYLSRTDGLRVPVRKDGASIYWHIHFKDGYLRATGEKEFSHVRNPVMTQGLFGSSDSISDYRPGSTEWHGTFIVKGTDAEDADRRYRQVMDRMVKETGASGFLDSIPKVI